MILKNQKGDSLEKFKEFKAQIENRTGKSIYTLQLDWRDEYLSTKFIQFLKEHCIAFQLTPPRMSLSNGVSGKEEMYPIGYGTIYDELYQSSHFTVGFYTPNFLIHP